MQINNPFQMNDWEIKKFLKVVLAVQLALWGVIGLDVMGLQISILRQLIGFIYLAFIPGIIILRIVKLHKLGNIETVLYTVGLSIATLMFTGLFMNTIYPLFGISGPISTTPLIITISVVVLGLCVLCYVRDKDFHDPSFIDNSAVSPPALFLCLLPFLAVFGTYLMNFYQTNIILIFLILIIAIIAVLIAFDKFIPKNLYPLAVFVIAISLLFHRSLISMYLWGCDIQVEYYLGNLVKMNWIWDPTVPGNCNAMLSVVMLGPIFSDICGMNLAWFYKIIYPLLFSLVPLGLYRVFQKQTDDKIAFLSCFFFMIVSYFYGWMLWLPRQGIAELFLVLLILLMIDKNMDKIKRSLFFIVFGISLVVSHYALSYIYMFCLISAWLILVSGEYPWMQKLMDNFYSKFGGKREEPAGNPNSLKIKDRTISSTFVLLFIIFTLTWYMYLSSSSAFNSIVYIGDHIASSIFTDFLNPEAAQGLHLMMAQPHPGLLHEVNRVINYLNQIFIVIGVLVLLKYKELKFEREYVAFSMLNLAMLFAAIAVPFFASALRMERLYHITLIFLAPFCVIGGITVFRMMSKVIRVHWTNKAVRRSLQALSVFFAISLLYNTGVVFGVAEGHYGSISLNSTVDRAHFNDQEALMTEWLKDVKDVDTKIYSDLLRGILLLGIFGERYVFTGDEEKGIITRIPDNAYIFLGRENVKNKKMLLRSLELNEPNVVVDLQNSTFDKFNNTLFNMSRIYNNGDAVVYYR